MANKSVKQQYLESRPLRSDTPCFVLYNEQLELVDWVPTELFKRAAAEGEKAISQIVKRHKDCLFKKIKYAELPKHLRTSGIELMNSRKLVDTFGEEIGAYMDTPIFDNVTLCNGVTYHYEHPFTDSKPLFEGCILVDRCVYR